MFGHRFFGSSFYGPRYFGDGGDIAPPEPPPVVEERQQQGGIPSRRRRRNERVYINIDGRVLWFKNAANAEAYLRRATEEIAQKIERQAEGVVAEIIEERPPERIAEPVDWRSIPVQIPRVEVRGSEELEDMAREIETRFYAILMAIDKRRQRLMWEDELLLLN